MLGWLSLGSPDRTVRLNVYTVHVVPDHATIGAMWFIYIQAISIFCLVITDIIIFLNLCFFVPYIQCLVLFLHFPTNSNFKLYRNFYNSEKQENDQHFIHSEEDWSKKVLQKIKKIIHKMFEIFLNFSVDFKFSTSPEINTSPYCRQKFLFLKKTQ